MRYVRWALTAVVACAACSNLPTVTRTGEVKTVLIREDVAPSEVMVSPGDEIRWVNRRQGDVRIIFLSPVSDKMSCRQQFSGNEAKLSPNESASICLSKAGVFRYTVRMETALPVGELNSAGVIRVEAPEKVPTSSGIAATRESKGGE